jgi:hypothetical protein
LPGEWFGRLGRWTQQPAKRKVKNMHHRAVKQTIADALLDLPSHAPELDADGCDITNGDRAERAFRALQVYIQHDNPDANDRPTWIQDCINDLLHLAHQDGADLPHMLANAIGSFLDEATPNPEECSQCGANADSLTILEPGKGICEACQKKGANQV